MLEFNPPTLHVVGDAPLYIVEPPLADDCANDIVFVVLQYVKTYPFDDDDAPLAVINTLVPAPSVSVKPDMVAICV